MRAIKFHWQKELRFLKNMHSTWQGIKQGNYKRIAHICLTGVDLIPEWFDKFAPNSVEKIKLKIRLKFEIKIIGSSKFA